MCHASCLSWVGLCCRDRATIEGKRVLEVGAQDVNGTPRSTIEPLNPAEYIGVDSALYKGVDMVCDATELTATFGYGSFDVVVSTEMLEHVQDWRSVVQNFKGVLRLGGLLILTTRSIGFGVHAFPDDYWRFSLEQMRQIFADLNDLKVETDGEVPGVFVCGRKSEAASVDLSMINVFDMKTAYPGEHHWL